MILLGLLGMATGCTRRGGPDVQMVEGYVFFDGQPIDGASVGFSPVAGDQALPGIGVTKEDGSFRLSATRGGSPNQGIPAGQYSVVISKVTSVEPDSSTPHRMSAGGFPKVIHPGRDQMPYLLHLPEAYGDRQTSGLSATVKKGINKISFELHSNFETQR